MAQDHRALEAIDLNAAFAPDKLAQQLATKRVVFVGEIHDRYDHHLNQLEVIQLLEGSDPNLAIGVEYFPRSSQPHLDDYIAGKISEQEFLRASGYFENWGYDYRLYAPIFRYARERHIPVLALNVPNSLPAAVAKVGIKGLTEAQRANLPREMEPAGEAYRKRLRQAFQAHGAARPGDFEHFVEAQSVWDAGMAETAAAYLDANPGRRLVILCGSGHVAFGDGIPQRLERRTHATYAILLSSGETVEPHLADYLLLSEKRDLPPAGVLGVRVENKDGECRIGSLSPQGAAEKGGLKKGDALLAIDGQAVHASSDVRLALWDKHPGDRVHVQIRRKQRLGAAAEKDVDVQLGPEARPIG